MGWHLKLSPLLSPPLPILGRSPQNHQTCSFNHHLRWLLCTPGLPQPTTMLASASNINTPLSTGAAAVSQIYPAAVSSPQIHPAAGPSWRKEPLPIPCYMPMKPANQVFEKYKAYFNNERLTWPCSSQVGEERNFHHKIWGDLEEMPGVHF